MTATPAQIRYATKLRDDMALYGAFPVTAADLCGGPIPETFEVLGYATREEFIAAVPDAAARRQMDADLTDEQYAALARRRAEAKRARQAELGAADIESMSKTEISAYIDAVKSLTY